MGTQLHFSFPALNMAAHANMVTDFKVGTTINQFIAAMERRQPEATGALSVVLMEIAVACKLIASKIRRAGIADVLGKVSSENSTGDVQLGLHVPSRVLRRDLAKHIRNPCTPDLGRNQLACNRNLHQHNRQRSRSLRLPSLHSSNELVDGCSNLEICNHVCSIRHDGVERK